MTAVSLRSLTKSFGGAHAIAGIDLEIEAGEFFVLLGPSGCGKTTTLRCIAGLEEPECGTITIGQSVVADPAAAIFVPPHKRDIGMVFQNYALWPHLTVFDNVRYPLRARRVSGTAAHEAVQRALAIVGLSGVGDRRPSQLSGGQQQRVALARAIVGQPPLLLFDEPLSNLDAQLRLRLRQDLRRIHRETGHAAVYVTHDQSEALALADRVAVMRSGAVEQLGAPEEIFLKPATAFVAQFVGFDNFLRGTVAKYSDGEVTATLPGWPRPLLARSARPFAAGAAVELAIRSSRVEVRASGANTETATGFPARLEDASYAGTEYQCALQVGPTSMFGTMELHQFAALAARPSEVTVHIRPSDIIALAADVPQHQSERREQVR